MLRDTFTWQLYSTGIWENELDKKKRGKNDNQDFRKGVGNSFGFAGHIRDKLGIHRPVNV